MSSFAWVNCIWESGIWILTVSWTHILLFRTNRKNMFSNQLVQGNLEPKTDNSVQNSDAKVRSCNAEELQVENPISGNISQAPGTKDFLGQLEHTELDDQSFLRRSASGNCHSRIFRRSWKNHKIKLFKCNRNFYWGRQLLRRILKAPPANPRTYIYR